MFGAWILLMNLLGSHAQAEDSVFPDCTIPVYVSQASVPLPIFKQYTHSIYDAAGLWNDVSEDFHFYIKDWNFKSEPAYGTVTVSMTKVQQLQPNQIALTWNKQYDTGFSRSRVEVDNTWNYCTPTSDSSTCVSMFNVFVHEFGHVLGLDHSDDPNSVMYSVMPLGPTRKALTTDDIRAVRELYQPDGSSCTTTALGTLVWALD